MSISRRTIFLVKDPHNVRAPRLLDWAKLDTTIGPAVEPYTGGRWQLSTWTATAALTADVVSYDGGFNRIDEVQTIPRGWEKRILATADDGGPALHGGTLIQDGGL